MGLSDGIILSSAPLYMLGVETACVNYFVSGSNEKIEIPSYFLPWRIVNQN
jgi:hypothetical protein